MKPTVSFPKHAITHYLEMASNQIVVYLSCFLFLFFFFFTFIVIILK